jgi:hypothetical protein
MNTTNKYDNNHNNIVVDAVPIIDNLDSVVINVTNNNLSDNVKLSFALGKTIKFLACIDIFFSFFYAMINFWYFIPLLFGFVGYYGAKNYNSFYTFLYLVYSIMNLLSRIFLFGFFIYQENNDNNENSPFYYYFLLALIIFLEIWINKIVFKFYQSLRKLNLNELDILRTNKLKVVRTIYW